MKCLSYCTLSDLIVTTLFLHIHVKGLIVVLHMALKQLHMYSNIAYILSANPRSRYHHGWGETKQRPEALMGSHPDTSVRIAVLARETDLHPLMGLVSVSFSIAGRENRTGCRLPWLCAKQTGSRGITSSPEKEGANCLGVCCVFCHNYLLNVYISNHSMLATCIYYKYWLVH